MKTIQEQIAIMQHYANGGDIEIFSNDNWVDAINPGWNWTHCDYRIKEQKKTVIIEKWLMKAGDRKSFFIAEGDKSYIKNYNSQVEKVRLLDTYDVEL